MTKKTVILLLAALVLVGSQTTTFSEGNRNNSKSNKQYYNEFYTRKNGFMPINEAVEIFENKYNKKVELPTNFPFKIMMQKAELITSHDQSGTSLKIHYLGEDSNDSLVIQIDNYSLKDTRVAEEQVTLKDGTKALVRKHRHFYFFEFEKQNGFRYMFGISKSTKTQITTDVMLQIANSMTSNSSHN